MLKAVYPGSFDPMTKGHLDIIMRASNNFDKLIVAVLNNINKSPVFTLEERIDMIKDCTRNMGNIEVKSFSGLLVDFVEKEKAKVVIKGLRDISDFQYELQMSMMNKMLKPEIETMFMLAAPQYSFYSSSAVKEVAKYDGRIDELVPFEIIDTVKKGLSKANNF